MVNLHLYCCRACPHDLDFEDVRMTRARGFPRITPDNVAYLRRVNSLVLHRLNDILDGEDRLFKLHKFKTDIKEVGLDEALTAWHDFLCPPILMIRELTIPDNKQNRRANHRPALDISPDLVCDALKKHSSVTEAAREDEIEIQGTLQF